MSWLPSWEEKRENLGQSPHSELGVIQVTREVNSGFQDELVLTNAQGKFFLLHLLPNVRRTIAGTVRIRVIFRSLMLIMRVSWALNLALAFASYAKWSSSVCGSANAFRAKIQRTGEVPVFPQFLTSAFLSFQFTSAFKGKNYILPNTVFKGRSQC